MTDHVSVRSESGPFDTSGSAVRSARVAAGLKQAEIADRVQALGINVSQGWISQLERGQKMRGLSERLVTALAAALGVGVTEITGGSLLSREESLRTCELLKNVTELIVPGMTVSGRVAA